MFQNGKGYPVFKDMLKLQLKFSQIDFEIFLNYPLILLRNLEGWGLKSIFSEALCTR